MSSSGVSVKRRRLTFAAAGVVIVAAAIAIIFVVLHRGSNEGTSTPAIDFSQPGPGPVGVDGFPLSGTSRNLAAGTKLWVVTRADSSDATYQPANQPCIVQEAGDWACPRTYVGGSEDGGKRYRVAVYSVTQPAIDAFLNYDRTKPPNSYPGLPTLPAGAQEINHVFVSRA